ncbi:MAG: aspartyl protease family protein [Marinilabiliaceae bacterium]|nr:aspartyl protease family protein [Marinilabiliaceae bacterium]
MIYQFERDPVGGTLLVEVRLNRIYKMKMVLDTAASITTFDVNALRVVSYPIGNTIETGMVETASGIMPVDIIETNTMSAFGHTVYGMNVQIYDYLVYGIISGYEGVLGLDFFENTKFCIDMVNQTIEVHS